MLHRVAGWDDQGVPELEDAFKALTSANEPDPDLQQLYNKVTRRMQRVCKMAQQYNASVETMCTHNYMHGLVQTSFARERGSGTATKHLVSGSHG